MYRSEEVADDEFFGALRVQMGCEVGRPISRWGVGAGIGIIANLDVRVIYGGFQKHGAFVMRAIWQDHGVFGAGGWKVAWG